MKAFLLSPAAHFTAKSRRIPWQRFNFRNLVSPSLKEPSQSGSRQSATPLLKTRSCLRFPPTRSTPKFRRRSVACSPRFVLPRATLSMSEPLLQLLATVLLLPLPQRRLLHLSQLQHRHLLSKPHLLLHQRRLRRPLQHQCRRPLLHQHRPQLLRLLRLPPARCCRRLSVVSSAITDSMPLALPAPDPMVASLAPM